MARSKGILSVGDMVPDFSLLASNGRTVSSAELLGRGPLVIYFYPRDDTPGCTKEACSFRDLYMDLREAGAEVVGISSSSPASQKAFAEKHRLPFLLLSDREGKVRKLFGVQRTWGLLPGRATYVVGNDGRILYIFSSQFDVESHVRRALEFINSNGNGAGAP